MTTIVTGINKQSTISLQSLRFDYAALRVLIDYKIINQSIEPPQDLSEKAFQLILQDAPAPVDGDGVAIGPPITDYSDFGSEITGSDQMSVLAKEKAVAHAQIIGVFVEYVDPTDDSWTGVVAPPAEDVIAFSDRVGAFVAKGLLLSFNSVVYRVFQPHVAANEFNPELTLGVLFKIVPSSTGGGLPAWLPFPQGPLYAIGDEVFHTGEDWRSRRANNVSEPGTAAAGWLRISGVPYEWFSIGNEGYPIGWIVLQNGNTYLNNLDNNFWDPNTGFGWVIQ